eukprot:jgi/Mesen1/8533/ME000482S07991
MITASVSKMGPMLALAGVLAFLHLCQAAPAEAATSLDYRDALNKAILFYEGQRSGKLDSSTLRARWRNDSGLTDGQQQDPQVDLTGGYYDAGDNIKFGFPMAVTITNLAWSTIETKQELQKQGQLAYARDAIKWGADWIIKAHTAPFELWGQVGDPGSDHGCWMRPESMEGKTKRTAWRITQSSGGTELAGESAAALAATAIVFADDSAYARTCLDHAKQLFVFANTVRKNYHTTITAAAGFYTSFSGYMDELVWAAAWLYRATHDPYYLDFGVSSDAAKMASEKSVTENSWDDKFAGSQIMWARVLLKKDYDTTNATITTFLQKYKLRADDFTCANLPNNPKHSDAVKITPGGHIWIRQWLNNQYVTNAAFLIQTYGDYLRESSLDVLCGSATLSVNATSDFAKFQMDYILGQNPLNVSFMVGFGNKWPRKIHHRGASIVSINKNGTDISCNDGFNLYFYTKNDDQNVHEGAIVGGTDEVTTTVVSDWGSGAQYQVNIANNGPKPICQISILTTGYGGSGWNMDSLGGGLFKPPGWGLPIQPEEACTM